MRVNGSYGYFDGSMQVKVRNQTREGIVLAIALSLTNPVIVVPWGGAHLQNLQRGFQKAGDPSLLCCAVVLCCFCVVLLWCIACFALTLTRRLQGEECGAAAACDDSGPRCILPEEDGACRAASTEGLGNRRCGLEPESSRPEPVSQCLKSCLTPHALGLGQHQRDSSKH